MKVKEWEPTMLIGSSLGFTAVCSCAWRTSIMPTLAEAIDTYHEHVIDAGHELQEV